MRSIVVSTLLLCTAACAAPVGFEQFCFKCHDATQSEGDLDLEAFVSKKPDSASLMTLEDVMLRIEEGDMPPKKSRKQPNYTERTDMIAWARGQLDAMAEATMDDPGVVMMPRLTRHEYRNVIRDLSGGIVLKAGELLPNEGGAGEGFSNVGEAQGMSMAQFEKYLEAAKGALRHLRASPHAGLVWSAVPHEPVEDAQAQIKEACDDIIAWHVVQQQKWGRDHREDLQQRLGFNDAAYLEAAWHRRHVRDFMLKDQAGTTVALAPVVLDKWQAILSAKEPQEPFVAWAKAWQTIPRDTDTLVRSGKEQTGVSASLHQRCIEIVAGKAVEKPAGLLPEGYAPPYEISFHEAITEVVGAATERGVWPFRIAIGDAKELFFVVTDAGDGSRGESATWRKGRFQFADGTAKPWQNVTQVFGANSGKAFPFGRHSEDGRTLPPDCIGVKPPGALKITVPHGATLFELELALDPPSVGKSSVQAIVLREKPKSQSYIPGRMVFGGKKSDAREARQDTQARELERALRKRNISEANVTKIGLNAERNIFSTWSRTPLEAIGGPWPDQTADVEEPLAPYHLTAAQVRRNATPEDLAALHELENRLFALTQPFPGEMKFVTDFARRAWRRDLIPQEIERLAQLYREALQPGVSFDSAMKASLLAVLMSPEFLYHGDTDNLVRSGKVQTGVSASLASRLSFFLWASIPDDELLAADLTKPDVIKAQARRMLKDPRARSLATDFAAQVWGFADFEHFTGPDEKRFPEFTPELRQQMLDEVITSLNRVFMHDESLTRLLDEDCIATKPLFLTKTSLPLRTSPVQRGAWVEETLLGRRIPPPPVVPAISEDETNAAGLNIRQQLERHRADPSCAACHAKIDPPGLALEAFDPIGRPRKITPDPADTIQGIDGLKLWLASGHEDFIRNLNRKLLGYALGRAVLPGDKRLLERMRGQEKFSELVAIIVTSPQFTSHR